MWGHVTNQQMEVEYESEICYPHFDAGSNHPFSLQRVTELAGFHSDSAEYHAANDWGFFAPGDIHSGTLGHRWAYNHR